MTTTPPPITPPPSPRQVPERATNGLALASLILGIVGFLINPLLIASILALIFGIIGLRRAPALGRKNMAIVGIVLAVVSAIVSVVLTFVILGSINRTAQSISPDASAAASEPAVVTPSEEVAEPESDIPDGYEALTDDIYFKWGKLDTSNQFLATKEASVIAPNGCGTLYISAVLLDAEGTNVGSGFATASGIEPGGKADIEFLFTDDLSNVDQIKTNEATCY